MFESEKELGKRINLLHWLLKHFPQMGLSPRSDDTIETRNVKKRKPWIGSEQTPFLQFSTWYYTLNSELHRYAEIPRIVDKTVIAL